MKQFCAGNDDPPPHSSIPLGNLHSGTVCNKHGGLCLSSLILTNTDFYQWVYLNGKQKRASPNEHFEAQFLARRNISFSVIILSQQSTSGEAGDTAHVTQPTVALGHVSAPTRAESHNTETNRNKKSHSLCKEQPSGLSGQWKEKNTSQKQKMRLSLCLIYYLSFPGGSDGKESACSAGDPAQSLGQEDPLEQGTATHSSILAWRIPWTEQPGRATAHGITESDRTERLTLSHFYFPFTFRVLSF